jgi:hypothetical protein
MMMKKIPAYIAAFTLGALVLSGCSNVFFEKSRFSGGDTETPDMPPGFGTVQVRLSRGAARTIMPAADLAGLCLEYWFTRDNGTPEKKTPAGSIFALEAGEYTLEVKAFADSDCLELAAQGETETAFTIIAGAVAETVNIRLRPVASGEGAGELDFNLTYPAGTTVETLTLARIAGAESPIDLKTAGANSGQTAFRGTKNDIPVGYYLLRVTLIKDSDKSSSGRTEVVHIYQNLKSELSYTFIADDFRVYRVTSSADSGPGSLRTALSNMAYASAVGDPPTIQVLLEPESVITLESNLPPIQKSLIIEGNGVTLTRAASFTVINDASQLLRITGGSANVTIRRVRFKNGRAEYGGAIRNEGNLTLESCIFTGNQAIAASSSAVGGAIYSSGNGTLTVLGCTFYNNTAASADSGSTAGGAISNYGTLNLTGNVFYGNSATYYSVVYNYTNGTINTGGYNVSDKPSGANNSGWIFDSDDAHETTMPVGPVSFKPLSGLAAEGIIAVLPGAYPTVDFYGDPIPASNAHAGAVQTAAGGFYLDLSVNNDSAGSVVLSAAPDEDGLFTDSVSITATPETGYSFGYWQIDGVPGAISGETLTLDLSAHVRVRVVFGRTAPVTIFTDGANSATTSGTLRYALTNAQNGDVITFSGVTPGTTEIALESALPLIDKYLIIEGNGVTLTRATSWNSNTAPLLSIDVEPQTGFQPEVAIRRVRFKDGNCVQGGAVNSWGYLTLESCIFSANRASGSGGSIYGGAVVSLNEGLTVRGCTFYDNVSDDQGGAVYAISGTLSLTGNLFYGNTADSSYPVARKTSGGAIDASYNVIDLAFGTGVYQAGWDAGDGDVSIGTGFANLPVSPLSFKLLTGSGAAGILPAALPANYPQKDFYGNTINGGGAAGAVQAHTAGGFYLDLSVNNDSAGSVTVNAARDTDGLVAAGPVSITAAPGNGYSFGYWQVDGVPGAISGETLALNLSAHARVRAVFGRTAPVTIFTDGAGSATTPGTLRHALTNAQNGDVITFSGVTAGTTEILLESALPDIDKYLIIEGNGVTLTRATSWNSNTAPLLHIDVEPQTGFQPEVAIRRVRFKDGNYALGGAISSQGYLTLESCIFSGNRASGSANKLGGAVYGLFGLTVRGCTFYENVSDNLGGAMVFGDGTLSLTGNLFYGNTANASPAAHHSNGGPVVALYNVVDVPFGTGNTASGWNAGTGDTSIGTAPASLPVSPVSSQPLVGKGATNKLPATLPEYYPVRDFYGVSISGGGAAGAVQNTTTDAFCYLGLSTNNPQGGSITADLAPYTGGFYSSGASVTITAAANTGYTFKYWVVDGVKTETLSNPVTLSNHTYVRAVFGRAITVNSASDSAGSGTTPGTLRHALTNAEDGDLITLSGVTTIELESPLAISQSLTIEGSGVTLTRSASWTAVETSSQLLRIIGAAEVIVRRVHFKNGRALSLGGAIYHQGALTLESCIFSGNETTGVSSHGAAIYSANALTLRGCTFYGNKPDLAYGTVYFDASGKTLTMTGNLFYGQTPSLSHYTTVCVASGNVDASYNVVDVPLGTEEYQAGWATGTGDTTFETLSITGAPINTTTFVPVAGLGNFLPTTTDFPATDFNGVTRTFPGAPGAVVAP